jgi:3-phenylpropionate/trans-cinnamate dioxygenase ferredoxin reductase subunit
MVETVAEIVDQAGATFYADPFEPAAPDETAGILGMLKTLVQAGRNPQSRSDDQPIQWQPEPYRREATELVHDHSAAE